MAIAIAATGPTIAPISRFVWLDDVDFGGWEVVVAVELLSNDDVFVARDAGREINKTLISPSSKTKVESLNSMERTSNIKYIPPGSPNVAR